MGVILLAGVIVCHRRSERRHFIDSLSRLLLLLLLSQLSTFNYSCCRLSRQAKRNAMYNVPQCLLVSSGATVDRNYIQRSLVTNDSSSDYESARSLKPLLGIGQDRGRLRGEGEEGNVLQGGASSSPSSSPSHRMFPASYATYGGERRPAPASASGGGRCMHSPLATRLDQHQQQGVMSASSSPVLHPHHHQFQQQQQLSRCEFASTLRRPLLQQQRSLQMTLQPSHTVTSDVTTCMKNNTTTSPSHRCNIITRQQSLSNMADVVPRFVAKQPEADDKHRRDQHNFELTERTSTGLS